MNRSDIIIGLKIFFPNKQQFACLRNKSTPSGFYLIVVGEEHTGASVDHLELEGLAEIGLESVRNNLDIILNDKGNKSRNIIFRCTKYKESYRIPDGKLALAGAGCAGCQKLACSAQEHHA